MDKFSSLYILEGLSREEIAYFKLMLDTSEFSMGETIIKEGEPSNGKAYFIQSGSVKVYRENQKITPLFEGDLFGELALITNEPRYATVIAAERVTLLSLTKEDFLLLYKRSQHFDAIRSQILMRISGNFYMEKGQSL